jgi:asparagine synthase (glutamine-hydrolysing)
MCSIIGYFNFKENTNNTISSLQKTNHRGKDKSGIYNGEDLITKNSPKDFKPIKDKTNFCMGHNLHSIVDFTPQPLKNKGVLVANCEIYNYQELSRKYNIKTQSDTKLLLELLDKTNITDPKEMQKLFNNLDGPYSFAYLRDNILILARDNIGIKPLCIYQENNKLAFASEIQALPQNSFELNPREYATYNLKTNEFKTIKKDFFKITPEIKDNYHNIKSQIKELFKKSIQKRIPQNKKIGLLFSGGTDSTLIALTLKELGIKFTCYTTNITGGNVKEGEDLKAAKQIAKECNLNLKIAQIDINNMENYAIKVMNIIQSKEYVKVSVAIPFFTALQKAKEDNIKIIFSGVGSEELFADYQRYRKADNINAICLEGLKTLWIRDLYRDDILSMYNNIELRVPFLDNKLIEYSMRVNPKHKIDKQNNRNKIILRDILKDMNLSKEFVERPKKAAQYGSKCDKILSKLAKQKGMKKQEYLNSLK